MKTIGGVLLAAIGAFLIIAPLLRFGVILMGVFGSAQSAYGSGYLIGSLLGTLLMLALGVKAFRKGASML